MSVVQVLNVKLQRGDQSVSWGFNVQGGKEFHSPLVVQKVNPASLADRCSIRPGDYILKIGNIITENLTHNQARDAIVRQGNLLELTLQRGAPPRPDDYTAKLDFPQHQLMTPENLEPRPTLSPQVGVQLGKNRALLTQSYNSPVGLYSSQNIAETLVSTMKNGGLTTASLPSNESYYAPPPQPQYSQPRPQPAPQPHYNTYQSPASQQQPQRFQPAQRLFNPGPAPAPAPPRNGQRNVNRGVKGSAFLNNHTPSGVPTCAACTQLIRGPFVSAIGKTWCPNHFVCAHPSCGSNLQDCGFVEEDGKLYCEKDYEQFFAPRCHKCHQTIMSDCCYALEKSYHPECFVCAHCKQKLSSGTFHIENGLAYCPRDFNALFATKCAGCEFPVEAGDKFLEALGQNWHVECFICSTCNVPLHASGFAAKGNKPYCKKHAH